jgi:formiminotetrahydrofolate cyclodeaminase
MMAGLTEGRREFQVVDSRVREIHLKLTGARETLYLLVEEDSIGYQSLLDALKLPRKTAAEIILRTEAVEKGKRSATETPLRMARALIEVLDSLKVLIEVGNPNARCDAAVGAQLAFASVKAAHYNVNVNIRRLRDGSYARACSAEISELVRKAQEILQQIDEIVAGS